MNLLTIWSIYDHPSDYPDDWVVRRWSILDGQTIAGPAFTYKTLSEARASVPDFMVWVERDENDDPTLVESWF